MVVEPYPSEKWWSSSIGIMKFPTEWKVMKVHGSKPPTSIYTVHISHYIPLNPIKSTISCLCFVQISNWFAGEDCSLQGQTTVHIVMATLLLSSRRGRCPKVNFCRTRWAPEWWFDMIWMVISWDLMGIQLDLMRFHGVWSDFMGFDRIFWWLYGDILGYITSNMFFWGLNMGYPQKPSDLNVRNDD